LEKRVGDILTGLGDVAYAVLQKAINLGLDIALTAIPEAQGGE